MGGGDIAILKSGSSLGVTISGFTLGDTVDFEAAKYASTDTVTYKNGGVTIKDKASATPWALMSAGMVRSITGLGLARNARRVGFAGGVANGWSSTRRRGRRLQLRPQTDDP